jgi:hypothetical protein
MLRRFTSAANATNGQDCSQNFSSVRYGKSCSSDVLECQTVSKRIGEASPTILGFASKDSLLPRAAILSNKPSGAAWRNLAHCPAVGPRTTLSTIASSSSYRCPILTRLPSSRPPRPLFLRTRPVQHAAGLSRIAYLLLYLVVTQNSSSSPGRAFRSALWYRSYITRMYCHFASFSKPNSS